MKAWMTQTSFDKLTGVVLLKPPHRADWLGNPQLQLRGRPEWVGNFSRVPATICPHPFSNRLDVTNSLTLIQGWEPYPPDIVTKFTVLLKTIRTWNHTSNDVRFEHAELATILINSLKLWRIKFCQKCTSTSNRLGITGLPSYRVPKNTTQYRRCTKQ